MVEKRGRNMTDICPICGGKLEREIWLENPPVRGLKCEKCGRVEEIFRKDMKTHPRTDHKGRPYPF